MTKYKDFLLSLGSDINQIKRNSNLIGVTSVNFLKEDKERPFHTNSYQIGIDNHASASMIYTLSYFIQELKSFNIEVKGIRGHVDMTRIGTVRWHI